MRNPIGEPEAEPPKCLEGHRVVRDELTIRLVARGTDRERSLEMIRKAGPITGAMDLSTGIGRRRKLGVTELACKRKYPVFVDDTVELFDVISVPAGIRGAAPAGAHGLPRGRAWCCGSHYPEQTVKQIRRAGRTPTRS